MYVRKVHSANLGSLTASFRIFPQALRVNAKMAHFNFYVLISCIMFSFVRRDEWIYKLHSWSSFVK